MKVGSYIQRMLKRHWLIFSFHFNHYQDVIRVSSYCSLKKALDEGRNKALDEGRNVRNKLVTMTLAVIFMINMYKKLSKK